MKAKIKLPDGSEIDLGEWIGEITERVKALETWREEHENGGGH